jgi:phospholipase/carboxylesterase
MTTAPLLDCIEIETAASPHWTVIWLHGLGADGSDFVPVIPELGLPPGLGIRFIFPNAPAIPVTCNGGYVMPAWYDILSLSSTARVVDEAGIRHTCEQIRHLIARENQRSIPCHRIVLAGFSQGGAIAYSIALTHPERLAGVMALSTYIPSQSLVDAGFNPDTVGLPIFAAHGTEDDVVAPTLGLQARDYLLGKGLTPDWHTYPMPHSLCLEEVIDIGNWLKQLMAASDSQP